MVNRHEKTPFGEYLLFFPTALSKSKMIACFLMVRVYHHPNGGPAFLKA